MRFFDVIRPGSAVPRLDQRLIPGFFWIFLDARPTPACKYLIFKLMPRPPIRVQVSTFPTVPRSRGQFLAILGNPCIPRPRGANPQVFHRVILVLYPTPTRALPEYQHLPTGANQPSPTRAASLSIGSSARAMATASFRGGNFPPRFARLTSCRARVGDTPHLLGNVVVQRITAPRGAYPCRRSVPGPASCEPGDKATALASGGCRRCYSFRIHIRRALGPGRPGGGHGCYANSLHSPASALSPSPGLAIFTAWAWA